MNWAACFLRSAVRNAPVFVKLRQRRLNLTSFIGTARLEHRLFSVPNPAESKPGMRLRKHRCLKLCFLPAPAAVGGYVHPADHAPTGPGQAGDLVKSAAGYLESTRWAGNHGFRRHLKMVPARLSGQIGSRHGVVHAFIPSHVGLVHDFDMSQPLHTGGPFEAEYYH